MLVKSKAIKVSGPKKLSIDEVMLDDSNDGVLVKVTRGGICGSDIHYFNEGGIGDFKLLHPMTLGHEVIGVEVESGRRVAINPSKPCNKCKYCLDGISNQCVDMEFFGSAMRNPHVNGGFSEYVQVRADQLISYDENISDDVMAFAEPLAVAIHAVNQSGGVLGKKVLVTGCGPIGCLIIAACSAAGASEIVATDLSERCREIATVIGASSVYDAGDEALNQYSENKGYFDVSFEASGAIPAIHHCIDVTKAYGNFVQVGMRPGMVEIPLTKILAKEIKFSGSFRFTSEFVTAVEWLEKGLIDPLPLLTKTFDYKEIIGAIELANDKNKAMKVQISFKD
ncbi:alcohol dehydrogenase catalytic domain-containing protein [Vibrio sp. DW001]|uniref:zinc-binding dehydrogenase n=1 Tax=Vibrio sp. DW001 TaxID=2912315 RepID=UPI0023B1FF0F|nr:alcohol dehydrogenase catalytic domain-containing protein [Vibrio sp. DW001]WED26752.1 alcohol dehydrogenase catalytic domain-containing protein [Vibrio sp. DW001]